MVWHHMIQWCGKVWYGVVCLTWYGMASHDIQWCGKVWYGVVCLTWYGMASHDIQWCGNGVVRYGMVWYV